MRQSDIQSVEVPMQNARALAYVMLAFTALGCSTGEEQPRPAAPETESTPRASEPGGPRGSLTTLPWDQVDLEGRLLDIEDRRNEDCTTDTCVLGLFTITDAVAATSAGTQVPIGETRLVVTEETQLLGCGPSDGRVLIMFDEFLATLSEVTGEVPTVIWTAGGMVGRPPDPAVAAQVVSGSCG
jgi:hypothetical protein